MKLFGIYILTKKGVDDIARSAEERILRDQIEIRKIDNRQIAALLAENFQMKKFIRDRVGKSYEC